MFQPEHFNAGDRVRILFVSAFDAFAASGHANALKGQNALVLRNPEGNAIWLRLDHPPEGLDRDILLLGPELEKLAVPATDFVLATEQHAIKILDNLAKVSEKSANPLLTVADVRAQAHYTQFEIQPMEFIGRNGLGFLEGNVVKYVCRYRAKNGIEDLKKARHYLDCLIEREERGTITLPKRTA